MSAIRFSFLIMLLLKWSVGTSQPLTAEEREMVKANSFSLHVRISAPIDSVWSRWGDAKGMEKFFAPSVVFKREMLSVFEVHFMPTAPAGSRGAENNRLLAFQERELISFTWDAPPNLPDIRKQRTMVTVRFYELDENQTLVTLSQTGFGKTVDWQKANQYLRKAWGEVVLPRLKYSLENGPIDWSNPPTELDPALEF